MTFDAEIFVAVLLAYALIVISPGPNFILVTQYALHHSAAQAFLATIGFAVGATVNASLTLFGVGALIIAYPLFEVAVSILGGLFLIYLGGCAVASTISKLRLEKWIPVPAGRSMDRSVKTTAQAAPLSQSKFAAAQKGFLVNLLNPKGIAFFIGLYAPLMAKAAVLTKLFVLTASFLIELVWYGIVIAFLTRPVVRHLYDRGAWVLDMGMGLVLMTLGSKIIFGIHLPEP